MQPLYHVELIKEPMINANLKNEEFAKREWLKNLNRPFGWRMGKTNKKEDDNFKNDIESGEYYAKINWLENLNRPFGWKLNDELDNELNNELSDELSDELNNELLNELLNDVSDELSDESDETRIELLNKLTDELLDELSDELTDEKSAEKAWFEMLNAEIRYRNEQVAKQTRLLKLQKPSINNDKEHTTESWFSKFKKAASGPYDNISFPDPEDVDSFFP